MHEYAGISISCSNLGNYNHFLSCMIDEIRIWAHTFACSFCTCLFLFLLKKTINIIPYLSRCEVELVHFTFCYLL
jgi:hypothetical protein